MDVTKTTNEIFEEFKKTSWQNETDKDRELRYDYIRSFSSANPSEVSTELDRLCQIERLTTSLICGQKQDATNCFYEDLLQTADLKRQEVIQKLKMLALETKPKLTALPTEVLATILSKISFDPTDVLNIPRVCRAFEKAMQLAKFPLVQLDFSDKTNAANMIDSVNLASTHVKIRNYSEKDLKRDDKQYRLACKESPDPFCRYEALAEFITTSFKHHRELIDYTSPVKGKEVDLFGSSGLFSRMPNLQSLTFEDCFFRRVLGGKHPDLNSLRYLELSNCQLEDTTSFLLWLKVDTIVFRSVTLKSQPPMSVYRDCLHWTATNLDSASAERFPGVALLPQVRHVRFGGGKLRFAEKKSASGHFVVPHEVAFLNASDQSVVRRRCLAYGSDLLGKNGLFGCRNSDGLVEHVSYCSDSCFESLESFLEDGSMAITCMRRELLQDRIKFTFYVDVKTSCSIEGLKEPFD